jgi:hypothetical protein
MRRRHHLLLATTVGAAVTLAGVATAGALGVRPSFIGESHPTPIEHLRPAGVTSPSGYVPVTPCRILDTRSSTAGKLTTSAAREVQVVGTSGFPAQGGASNGCGIPSEATAVAVSITATSPDGSGFLRAWPHTSAPPTATILNWQAVGASGVTTGATLEPGNGKVDVRAFGNATHLVIDVAGYYVEPITAQVGSNGDLAGWSRGIIYAGRSGTGVYALQASRPVTGCTVTVTPIDTASKGVGYGTGSYLYAYVNDTKTGAAKDANFTISAVC